MLFVEPMFFGFFAFVLTVYWLLGSNEWRKNFILVMSFVFYSAWDVRFACMLLALAAADWYLALRIQRTDRPKIRRALVTTSIGMNLSVLAYFKYLNFFIGSTVAFAHRFGFRFDQPTLHVVLPVGVSFFTFQSLSYTIDVYRREIPAVRSARDYLMFASFFPQLVAGPIVRPKYFMPQTESLRMVTLADVKTSLYLFLLGFLKKTAIADNISPYVDRFFAAPEHYSHLSCVTATWLYATQIFCDFSGYSDMAIAVAGLLGYRLALNFDAPYLSVSIQEFWRRWHISLSSWIRDYIYIPLGGSRTKTRFGAYKNLLLTMLAGGLWHGASWTFVVWGGLHGTALVTQQEFRRHVRSAARLARLKNFASWFLTLNFVCLCWILFRAPNFHLALTIMRNYLSFTSAGTQRLPLRLFVLPPALLLGQFLMRKTQAGTHMIELRLPAFAAIYGAAWSFAFAMLPLGYRPFIYFQF